MANHDSKIISRFLETESARIEKFGAGYIVITPDGESIYPTYWAMLFDLEKRAKKRG